MKKILAIMIVTLTVLFLVAGCTAPTETDNIKDNLQESITEETTTEETTNETTTGETKESSSEDWELFQFKPGQHLEYEMETGTGQDNKTGNVIIDVKEATGDEHTFSISYEMSGMSGNLEVTSTGEDLPNSLNSPQGMALAPFLFGTIWNPYITSYSGVGFSNWEYTQDGETVSWNWGEQNSYAGINCTSGTVSVNDQPVYTTCFSSDLGLSIYTEVLDEDTGETEYRAVLTNYSE